MSEKIIEKLADTYGEIVLRPVITGQTGVMSCLTFTGDEFDIQTCNVSTEDFEVVKKAVEKAMDYTEFPQISVSYIDNEKTIEFKGIKIQLGKMRILEGDEDEELLH